MATVKSLQTNFTSGVLDPKLAAREDIVFFFNGLKDAKNVIVIPQGGCTRRPAMEWARELAPVLSEISLAGATVTAPEGGTAANLHDDDEATVVTTSGNIGTTNPFVVAHVDHATAVTVTAVDVINFKLSSLFLDDEFFVQYSTDNSVWSNFGLAFNIDAANRSRRIRNAAGAITARYWRVARIGSTDTAATVSIAEIKFWEEDAALSEGKLLPFAFSTEEAYMFVASDKNIDVLKGLDYHGSISIPHLSAQLPVATSTQSLDTMLMFHKNVQPWKIFRQGGDDEFDYRNQEFENIPNNDYGAGVGGVDEVQVLNDGALFQNGNKMTLLLEGERTTTITGHSTRATIASRIQTALRALSNTSADGITVADASGDGFTVTFGGDDGSRPWSEISVSVMSGNAVFSTSRTTKGELPGEDIMSDARGWPRHGVFHQARLHIGGIPGVPDAYLASVLGDQFNFDIEQDDATRALLVRAESDQVSAIYRIVAGQNLTFFTNDSEYYIPSEVIDKDVVLKRSTGTGSKEGLPVHEVEGSLIFIQGVADKNNEGEEIGTSIQEFIFEETVQRYKANLLSKLSSHLIKNPVDSALRKLSSTDESNLILEVNEDGTATAYTVLREDSVNALVPMVLRTGDKIKAVAVDKKQRVYFITERVINGTARRFVEVWNDNLFLDCGSIVTVTAESFTATADQTAFVWTFTDPAEAAAIIVRQNGGRLDPEEYSVDLGTNTVTLNTGATAGDIIRIASGIKTVSGLDHLDGETVQTFIDGTQGPDYVISSSTLTLDEYADTEVQYGFDFDVDGALMPFRIPESETLSAEKVRVVNAILNLHETSGIDIRANGGDWQSVPLAQTDAPVLDKSTEELLFTGEKEIEGLLGIEVGAPFEFRQPGPGPFTLLGVTREVSL